MSDANPEREPSPIAPPSEGDYVGRLVFWHGQYWDRITGKSWGTSPHHPDWHPTMREVL